MAARDKIYGRLKEYRILRNWLTENKPEFLGSLYPERVDLNFDQERPIAYFSPEEDVWLFHNCPLSFITERLRGQYGNEYWDEEHYKFPDIRKDFESIEVVDEDLIIETSRGIISLRTKESGIIGEYSPEKIRQMIKFLEECIQLIEIHKEKGII
jgi:hypothetical protein